jgi:hypothetical protein
VVVGALAMAAYIGIQREIVATRVGDGKLTLRHWILMGVVVTVFGALAAYEWSIAH